MPHRTSADDAMVADILERSKLMEKLLQHYVRGISLDAESLRSMAAALPNGDSANPSDIEEISYTEIQANEDSLNDTEDLTLDENFTVKPLAHNTTRWSTFVVYCSRAKANPQIILESSHTGTFRCALNNG
jgi:hypothetical protein